MISSKRGTKSCRVLGSMKLRAFFVLVLVFVLPLFAVTARADILGGAESYSVLATLLVSNNAPLTNTTISGDVGGATCTGFILASCGGAAVGTINGTANIGNGAWTTALGFSNTAYTDLVNTPVTVNEGALTLGTGGALPSLPPGTYLFTPSVENLIGKLTLAGGSNPDPVWIFKMATAFTTATNSSIVVTGTGAANAGIYFEVGSQATLGVNSVVQGNFFAGTNITFDVGAQDTCGRAFTDTAAGTSVTFHGQDPTSKMFNLVNSGPCGAGTSGSPNGNDSGVIVGGGPGGVGTVGPGGPLVTTPEPGTFVLLGSGIAGLLGMARMKRVSARRA